MQYHIRALSPDNSIVQLTIEARNKDEALLQVERNQLLAVEISPAHLSAWNAVLHINHSGASRFSLVLFSQELVTLLNAGLTIVESLEALIENNNGRTTQSVLPSLLDGLREGKRLSTVFAEHPRLFPPLYIGIVKAAEGTSDLPNSLTRYIDYQTRIDKVRNTIISASIYPLILLCVGGGVTFFLIGYVVPKFAEVYQGTGRNLPWLSQLLLDWGQFISTYPSTLLVWIGGIALMLFLLFQYIAKQGGLSALLSQLPGIGERIRTYELARLYLTLGMLLEGGISIIQAIDAIRDVVSIPVQVLLQRAKEDIQSGVPLSAAFEKHSLVTPISMRMLRVGERSGKLGNMLTQSASFYDAEISRWIDRFTRMFEPLLMVVIGLVIGGIVILLYMPIFDLAGSLS